MAAFGFFGRNYPGIRIERTIADKLLEAATVVLLVLLWGLTVYFWHILPDVIPSHFNLSGEVNGWSNKNCLFLLAGVATLVVFIMGAAAYNPKMVNIPVRLNPKRLPAQYALIGRMARVCNVVLVFLFTFILLSIAASGLGIRSKLLNSMDLIMVAALLLVMLYYCVKINSAGGR